MKSKRKRKVLDHPLSTSDMRKKVKEAVEKRSEDNSTRKVVQEAMKSVSKDVKDPEVVRKGIIKKKKRYNNVICVYCDDGWKPCTKICDD